MVVRCGNFDVLKIIIEDKYVEDIIVKDENRRIILYIVSFYGKFNVCEYFVFKFFDLIKGRD